MKAYLIGIDIGTQGTKAALMDTKLQVLATAFEPSRIFSPQPGTAWQEGEDLYASCVHTIRDLMEKTSVNPADILAIGLDGQMAGIMGIDAQGNATTCYDSWLDTRCAKYMDQMNQLAGDRIVQITGGPATYTHGPKILWWKHEQRQAYDKTCKFVLPHTYVVGRMTGLPGEEAYFDYTHLHFSGFGDNAAKSWSEELLETFGVDKEKMARIVSPFEIVGKTTRAFAQASHIMEGMPVVAGCGDTAASTFGSGLFEKNRVLDCAGTASVLCSVVDSYVPDTAHKTLAMMRSPVDGLWLPLAYINGGGMCLHWFRDQLSGSPAASYSALDAEAAAVPAGSESLFFLPHFSGRVLPNTPHLKGSWLGLDFKHTRGHLFRSIMESIGYEYNYYLSALKNLYPNSAFSSVQTMGGGAKSDVFNQIKSDVLGLPISTFATGETALIGSAAIAGVGAGVILDYKEPVQQIMKKEKTFVPNHKVFQAYQDATQSYLKALEYAAAFYKNVKEDEVCQNKTK